MLKFPKHSNTKEIIDETLTNAQIIEIIDVYAVNDFQ